MREGQAPLSFLNLLLASFSAGIWLMWTALEGGGISSEVFMFLLCVGAVLLPLIILFRKKSSVGTVALCALLFCVLGAVRFWTVAGLSGADVFYAAGKNAEITGTVQEDLSIQPSSDGRGWRFRCLVEAQTIKTDVERNKAEGRLYVAGNAIRKEDIPKIQEGDILRARGRIKRIRGYKNPGQLDIERQARSQGITARLSAEKGAVEVIGRDASALSRYLTEVRRHYRSVLSEAMSEEDAAAIFAMLFGGYEGIRAEVLESFTATGIVHILSVSGSHITWKGTETAQGYNGSCYCVGDFRLCAFGVGSRSCCQVGNNGHRRGAGTCTGTGEGCPSDFVGYRSFDAAMVALALV